MDSSVQEVGDVLEKKVKLNNSQSRSPLQDYTNRINLMRSASGGGPTVLASSENHSKENTNKELPASTKSIPDKADRHSFSDCSYSSNNGQIQSVDTDTDTTAEFESVSEKDFQLATESSDQHQVIPVILTHITEDSSQLFEKTPAKSSVVVPQENATSDDDLCTSENLNNSFLRKTDISILADDLCNLHLTTPKVQNKNKLNIFSKNPLRCIDNLDNSFNTTVADLPTIDESSSEFVDHTQGIENFEVALTAHGKENHSDIHFEENFKEGVQSIATAKDYKFEESFEDISLKIVKTVGKAENVVQSVEDHEDISSHITQSVEIPEIENIEHCENIHSLNQCLETPEINYEKDCNTTYFEQISGDVLSVTDSLEETEVKHFQEIPSQTTPHKETLDVPQYEQNCEKTLSKINTPIRDSEVNDPQISPSLGHKLLINSEENFQEEYKISNSEEIPSQTTQPKETSDVTYFAKNSQKILSEVNISQISPSLEHKVLINSEENFQEKHKISNSEEVHSQTIQPEETPGVPHFEENCEEILPEVNDSQILPSFEDKVLINSEENFQDKHKISQSEEVHSQTIQPEETPGVPHFEKSCEEILPEVNDPQISPSFEGKVLNNSAENFQEHYISDNKEVHSQTIQPEETPGVPHFEENCEEILPEVNDSQILPTFEDKVLINSEENFQEKHKISNREEVHSQTIQPEETPGVPHFEENCEEILPEVNDSQILPSFEDKVLINSEENFQEKHKISQSEEVHSQTIQPEETPGVPHFEENCEEILPEVNDPEISPSFEGNVLNNSEENFQEHYISDNKEVHSQTIQPEETPGVPHFEENCEEILPEVNDPQISPSFEGKVLNNSAENFQEHYISDNKEVHSQTIQPEETPGVPHFEENCEEILPEVNDSQILPSFEDKVLINSEENFQEKHKISQSEEVHSQTIQPEETPGVPHFEENCEEILPEVNDPEISPSFEGNVLNNSEENFQEHYISDNKEVHSQTIQPEETPGVPHLEENCEEILPEVNDSQILPTFEDKVLINSEENFQEKHKISNSEEVHSQTIQPEETPGVPHFEENCEEILPEVNDSQILPSFEDKVLINSEENFQEKHKISQSEEVHSQTIQPEETPGVPHFEENCEEILPEVNDPEISPSFEGNVLNNSEENFQEHYISDNKEVHSQTIQPEETPGVPHFEENCEEILPEVNDPQISPSFEGKVLNNSAENFQEHYISDNKEVHSQTIQPEETPGVPHFEENCEEILPEVNDSQILPSFEDKLLINSEENFQEKHKISQSEEVHSQTIQPEETPGVPHFEENCEEILPEVNDPEISPSFEGNVLNNSEENFQEHYISDNKEVHSQTIQPEETPGVPHFEENCEEILSEVNVPQILPSFEDKVLINSEENFQEKHKISKSEEVHSQTIQPEETSGVPHFEENCEEILPEVNDPQISPSFEGKVLNNSEKNFQEHYISDNKEVHSQTIQPEETPGVPHFEENCEEILPEVNVPQILPSFEDKVLINSEENFQEKRKISKSEEVHSQTIQPEKTPGVPHFEENCEDILPEVNGPQISPSFEGKVLNNSEENFQEHYISDNKEVHSQTIQPEETPFVPHFEENCEEILPDVTVPIISPSFEGNVLITSEENFQEEHKISNIEEIHFQNTQSEETLGIPHFKENSEEILSEVNNSLSLEQKVLINSEENFQEKHKISNSEEIPSQTTLPKNIPDEIYLENPHEEILPEVNTAIKESEVNNSQISPSLECKVLTNSEENFLEESKIASCEEIPFQTTQPKETISIPHFEGNCEEILFEVNVSQVSPSLEHKLQINSEACIQEEPKFTNYEEISSETIPSNKSLEESKISNCDHILSQITNIESTNVIEINKDIISQAETLIVSNFEENADGVSFIIKSLEGLKIKNVGENVEELPFQTTQYLDNSEANNFVEDIQKISSPFRQAVVRLEAALTEGKCQISPSLENPVLINSEGNTKEDDFNISQIQQQPKNTNCEEITYQTEHLSEDIETDNIIEVIKCTNSQIRNIETTEVSKLEEKTEEISTQPLEESKFSNLEENIAGLSSLITYPLSKSEITNIVEDDQEISSQTTQPILDLKVVQLKEKCEANVSKINTTVTDSELVTPQISLSLEHQLPNNFKENSEKYYSNATDCLEELNITNFEDIASQTIQVIENPAVRNSEVIVPHISQSTEHSEIINSKNNLREIEGLTITNFEELPAQTTNLGNIELSNFNYKIISKQIKKPTVPDFEEKTGEVCVIAQSLKEFKLSNLEENSKEIVSQSTKPVESSEVIAPHIPQSLEHNEVINSEENPKKLQETKITNIEQLPCQNINLIGNIESTHFIDGVKEISSQITQHIEKSEVIAFKISECLENPKTNNLEGNPENIFSNKLPEDETITTNFREIPSTTSYCTRKCEVNQLVEENYFQIPQFEEKFEKSCSVIGQKEKSKIADFEEVCSKENKCVSNQSSFVLKSSESVDSTKSHEQRCIIEALFDKHPETIQSSENIKNRSITAPSIDKSSIETTEAQRSIEADSNYCDSLDFAEELTLEALKVSDNISMTSQEIRDYDEFHDSDSNNQTVINLNNQSVSNESINLDSSKNVNLDDKSESTENINSNSENNTKDIGNINISTPAVGDSSAFEMFMQSMHSVLTAELNKSEAGPITADEEFSNSECSAVERQAYTRLRTSLLKHLLDSTHSLPVTPTLTKLSPLSLFQDASSLDLEYLSSVGNNFTNVSETLTRQSLYVKFDPVVKKFVSNTGNMPPPPQTSGERPSTPPSSNKPEVQKTPVRSPAVDSVQKLISLTPTNTSTTKSDKSSTPGVSPAASPRVSVTPQDKESPKSRGFIPQDVLDRELQKLQDVMLQREQVYEETLTKMESDFNENLMKKDDIIKELQKKYEEVVEKEAKLRHEVQDKTKSKQQLSLIMEEYEKTISQLVAQKEEEKKEFEIQKEKIISERESVMQHLNNSEIAFNDVHVKYERSKTVIERMKNNEDLLKKNITEYQEEIKQMNEKYNILKNHAVQQIDKANKELDMMHKAHQSENAKLKAMLKKAEITINSLKESLEQKIKENQELTSICDELISKVN